MRLNENTQIIGKNVILVPYEWKHVVKYHKWMQSRELQKLTASEPLTLEEEYEMQRTWRRDEDKCTFLILCRKTYETTGDEIKALIGDTNLFLHPKEESGEELAEIEIMIAEPEMRAKIGMDNTKSIKMFQKIQFEEVTRSKVFQEVTLGRYVTEEWLKWLDKQVLLIIKAYDKN
ncbi:microtubule-associated Nat9 isoform 2-T2 [Glossina fuscipes fuscipes]